MKSYLQRHVKSHDPGSKKYECDICGDKFTRPYLVLQHQEFTHRKNLPFKCPECGKCLRSKTFLKIHLRSVHSKEKPFPCEVCGFRSSRVDNLNIHRIKVHNLTTKVMIYLQPSCKVVESLYGPGDAAKPQGFGWGGGSPILCYHWADTTLLKTALTSITFSYTLETKAFVSKFVISDVTGCQLIKRKVNIMPPPVRKKTARSSGKGSFMDSIKQVLRICDDGRVSSLNGGKAISKCAINVSIGPGSRLQCSYFRASAIG